MQHCKMSRYYIFDGKTKHARYRRARPHWFSSASALLVISAVVDMHNFNETDTPNGIEEDNFD